MILLSTLMKRFVQVGTLTILDAEGNPHIFKGAPGPEVTIQLKDRKLYRSLFLNPELHAGEAYMDGTLTIEKGTIRDFLVLAELNGNNLRKHPLQSFLHKGLKRVRKLHQRNDVKAAKQHVRHHYDLSNELYKLFLDKDLNYSCAYFVKPDDTIETAQQNKLRHITSKLDLKPGQRVLDIGCGWGGMALYLAAVADVEVLGVTLSTEQHALANQRAKERGLEKRVRFELMDYRDVKGPFDRIVSVGMFEHVGITHYDKFFNHVRDLLKPDGVALLHSIGRKGGPSTTGAWIRKYIFPGGYSPALSEVLASVERSKLWVTDIEILRLHYAKTLRAWEERFQANRPQITALMDERFCRMWEFYLIVSELSFSEGSHMVFQMQLAKEREALPITRDYMAQVEAQLKV
ncbi:MAG: class I SAM-dependent methyltransferase [Armatimonadetes bacterium]|nr:class I SAM-dependent methyltransferase [Akkermansiaceae bacterium]